MKFRRLTLEDTLYLLAFIVGFSLRFLHLGAAPLNDFEAGWALQALQLASGGERGLPILGPQPAYINLSGIFFALFSASNFLARFWPALAGSALVLAPVFFRNYIGRGAALVFAFGLAFDPGLTTVSRLAGGPMLAVAFGTLALGAWISNRAILAGIFAGLALLSGPQILTGILAFLLTWLVAKLLGFRWQPLEMNPDTRPLLRQALITAGVATLVLASMFFFSLQSLAAWFETIPAYLSGWTVPGTVPALRLLAALPVYQPLALILALVAVGGALVKLFLPKFASQEALSSNPYNQTEFHLLLFLWFLFSLLLVVVYPARQVADLTWLMIPLWALAALQLSNYLSLEDGDLISTGQALLVVLLMVIFWLNLAGLAMVGGSPDEIQARLGILLSVLALIALTTILIALGWSWDLSRRGLTWGISIGLGLYLFSVVWGATQMRPKQAEELWSPIPAPGQAGLLLETLQELSEWQTGFKNQVDVNVSLETPALRWLLREFPSVHFVREPQQGSMPTILITSDQEEPALAAAYRGQDFVWDVYPGWTGALPDNAIRWLTFRLAPLQENHVILWAREDVFPGGSLEFQNGSQPSPSGQSSGIEGPIQ
jgi:hypothetical protein